MRVVIQDLPHPVVFIGDAGNRLSIPADVSDAVVCATSNCLSVWARPSVDGPLEVEVRPFEFEPPPDLALAFDGELRCDSGVLGISDSSGRSLFAFGVEEGEIRLRLFVDDVEEPARLLILTA